MFINYRIFLNSFAAFVCCIFSISHVAYCADARYLNENISMLENMASGDDVHAQYVLGLRYQAGNGVSQNDGEAVKWFAKASEQGYAPAESSLALMYFTGRGGLVKNRDIAISLYKASASQGDIAAKYALVLNRLPIISYLKNSPFYFRYSIFVATLILLFSFVTFLVFFVFKFLIKAFIGHFKHKIFGEM